MSRATWAVRRRDVPHYYSSEARAREYFAQAVEEDLGTIALERDGRPVAVGAPLCVRCVHLGYPRGEHECGRVSP